MSHHPTSHIIRQLRQQKGLTQKQLAEQAGISTRTLQRIEADVRNLRGFPLRALAEVFELAPENLVVRVRGGGEGENGALEIARREWEQEEEEDVKRRLGQINLAALAMFILPFGNVLAPMVLWLRMSKKHPAFERGRRIVNFQILWTLTVCMFLISSPFLIKSFNTTFPLIGVFLGLMAVGNLVTIAHTARAI